MKLEAADPSIFETASHQISTEVEVGASTEDCWAVLNDHASWTEWFPGCTRAVGQPPHWTAPGETRQVTINRLNVSERAIIVEPEEDFAFTILEWPLPIAKRAAERVQLVDTSRDGEERTNLVYSAAFDLTFAGRLAWPILEGRLADAWGSGLEELHRYLNASAR